MSANEYIRYFAQTLFTHLNEPKAVRMEKRQQKKNEKPAFAYRWFGVVPWAIALLFKRK